MKLRFLIRKTDLAEFCCEVCSRMKRLWIVWDAQGLRLRELVKCVCGRQFEIKDEVSR